MQCPDDQRSPLLQLQHHLYYAPHFTFSSKFDLWDVNTDCCSWEGVTCDAYGHVLGIDLSCKNLSGSFHPIFNLHRLQRLNLAGNNFNTTLFSYGFDKLQNLTHLNLSSSCFHGQIPVEISFLKRLVSLDLSNQYSCYLRYYKVLYPAFYDSFSFPYELQQPLKLENPNFKTLIKNLRFLTEIYLDGVNISTQSAKWCETTSLVLSNLRVLSLSYCGLKGPLCSSLSRLSFLSKLILDWNPISYLPPNFLEISSRLVSLSLRNCNLSGHFPTEILLLPKIQSIDISFNLQLMGQLPEFQANNALLSLSLFIQISVENYPYQLSILQLPRLEELYIGDNSFSSMKLDMFVQLNNLRTLWLNNISLLIESDNRSLTFPQLERLSLRSCNLTEFPEFIKRQDKLVDLDLSSNHIHGVVPNWLWKSSLSWVDLSLNFLKSQENLEAFDASSNNLSGPIPNWLCNMSQLQIFNVSYNNLSGSIPNCLGNMSALSWLATQLQFLKVSENRLEGKLPRSLAKCVGNMINDTFPFWLEKLTYLRVLILRENRFYGQIKHFKHKSVFPTLDVLDIASNQFSGELSIDFLQPTRLRSLKIGGNKLEGKLSRSLANCTALEVLDLGNNMVHDTFPFWLEKLPSLKVLVLRENRFYGTISKIDTERGFPKLRILDVASNNFSGDLSIEFLQSLKAMANMTNDEKAKLDYIGESYYQDSVTIVNRGIEMFYQKVLTILTCLDLSNNSFHGRIPEEIQMLRSLRVMNLSNNGFSSEIPLALQNLKDLESLDLSRNKLSGKIPPQLTSLTFLAALNLSYNQLEGSIPQSNQFITFTNDSYRGNPKLCGLPLSRKCNEVGLPVAPPPRRDGESWLYAMSTWKIALIGYASGLVVGLCIGYTVLNELGNKWVDKFKKCGKRNRRCR
ncbi:hypothetical protein E1A91_D02G026600v1 [Gossypium mustelinum]|uniref:Leucine-rich repeat-containing N-terminal plant-type domain-containing protein n=1 Tax=Gossypium mustelinum TaxID=34275 RepID=A0A5D2VSA1_GOSMU|nr:hypothetical protein E1A91_D02G026600v1 [Gossypium mustelinum]